MKRFLIILIILLTFTGGCTSDKLHDSQEPLALTSGGGARELIERCETISDALVELYGIDDAASIILNDDLMIGVRVAYDDRLNNETRENIRNKVMAIDGDISGIYITDKIKLFNEINNIITEILQGKSYENFIVDIDNLRNRMK